MRPSALLLLGALLVVATAGAQEWPSFRGPNTAGVARDAHPPIRWDVASSSNVVWRTPVPGLGHSSPVVWGDRIYLTTAVAASQAAGAVVLGDADVAGIDPANDLVSHQWQVLAIHRDTGRILWTRTARQGVPRSKRHVKSSHASATPATNGQIVVAMLGSEGLFAFDLEGRVLWRQDLGALAVGLADDPSYEWGPASSPVIHQDLVIVQNDRYRDSYLIAFDVNSGKERWRSPREDLPGWTTPLVHEGVGRATVVAASARGVRAHDAATGRLVWQVADSEGEVRVSSPVSAGELAIVTGGYPPGGRPVSAFRIADGSVAWHQERGSAYTTTPLVFRGLTYVLTDNGILSAYDVKDGRRVYQQRVSRDAGGFSASPVAADDRLYLTSEDGTVFVVRAGPSFELLAANQMEEVCMATPALAGNLLIVRTRSHLYALGARPAPGRN
ncbi:MAG: outer membrane protein assembly factor BamB family protein [Acidobacteriota bacterium]